MTDKHWDYFNDMQTFFKGVPDPLDFAFLAARQNPNERARYTIEATAKLSGPDDRRTDANDNDFWVESTEVFN